MRRLMATKNAGGERGAVAVMFALLLVGLIGFIALAVDLGAVYSKRQELQNAADSAALAAAQECATTGCGLASVVAEDYAGRNTYDPLTDVVTTPEDNYVQVDVHGTQERWFLPVLGAAPVGPVQATAYATWGNPSKGTISLPLTISMCDFKIMVGDPPHYGVESVITLTKSGDGCDWDNDGNAMPGGFGFIGTGGCEVDIDIDDPWVPAYTGGDMPCDEIGDYLGQVILLPIFDACRMNVGTGEDECPYSDIPPNGGKEYQIYSFAAFELTGYRFPGDNSIPMPCSPPDRCISGKFLEWVTLEDAWNYGDDAPDLGASIVNLIDPRDIP